MIAHARKVWIVTSKITLWITTSLLLNILAQVHFIVKTKKQMLTEFIA